MIAFDNYSYNYFESNEIKMSQDKTNILCSSMDHIVVDKIQVVTKRRKKSTQKL